MYKEFRLRKGPHSTDWEKIRDLLLNREHLLAVSSESVEIYSISQTCLDEIHPSSIQPVKGLINQGLIVEGRLNRWYKSFWDRVKKT